LTDVNNEPFLSGDPASPAHVTTAARVPSARPFASSAAR